MKPAQFKQKIITELKTIKKSEIEELKNFVSYWSERTKSGKFIKYDLQETFDIPRRWGMWKRRAKEYNHKQQVLMPKWTQPKIPTQADRERGSAKLEELRKKMKFN